MHLLFFSAFCFSAGGGEIPVSFILFQALNFIIFLGILIYFIAKKAPKALQRKHQDYQSMNKRAEEQHQKALSENKMIKEKLSKAKNQFENFQEELDQKAREIKHKIAEETQSLCAGVLRGAQSQVDREFIQLKEKLKNDLLKQIEILCKDTKYEEKETSNAFLQKLAAKTSSQ